MEIVIRSLSGDVVPLAVSPGTTIAEIKNRVRAILGTPLYQQRLLFRGKILLNSNTLTESGITNMSFVYLVLAISKKTIGNIYNTRQIFAKTVDEKIITLNVQPYHTVHQIKSAIQEEEGIPYWRQILRFNGKVLKDEGRSLLSYDIYNGAILQVIISAQRMDESSAQDARLAEMRL